MAFGQSGGNRQIKQVNSGLAGNGICVVIVDNNGQIQSIAKGEQGQVLSIDEDDSLGFFPDIDPVYAADSAMIVFFADTVTKIATKADIQTIISVGAYILNNKSSAQTGNIWIGKTTDTAYKGLIIQNKKTLATNNENQIVLGNGSTLLGASDRTYYLTNKMTSATAAQFALKYWNGTATFTPFVVNSDQTVTFDSTITISNGILDTHAATVGQMRDSIDEFVSMPVEVSSDNMLVKTVGTSDREIEETGVSILDDNSIVTPGYIQAGKDTTIEGVLRTDCIRDIYGNTIFSYIGQGIRIGDKSGYESEDGQGIFIGANSGYSSDGAENVFIGELSGETNIGNSNVGIGFNSAQSSLGDDNVFIGYYSGYNNSSSSNTGIGEYSLSDNEGMFNTGIGSYSLSGNSGDYNFGAGQGSLIGNSGNNVCGIGYLSAAENTGHSVNGIGILSLGSNKSSYSNAFGAYSLRYVKSVSGYLTAIGHYAATGSSSDSINAVNATAIGANSTINASNSINLGDGSVNKLYMANKEVFYQPLQYGTAGTSGQLLVASGANTSPVWTSKSSISLTAFDSTGFRVKPSQITGFSESDPVWTSASANYYTKTNMQGNGTASLHFNNLTNKPTTLSGYGITDGVTASSTNTFTNKSGNISMWTNNSGYITSSSLLWETYFLGAYVVPKDNKNLKIKNSNPIISIENVGSLELTVSNPGEGYIYSDYAGIKLLNNGKVAFIKEGMILYSFPSTDGTVSGQVLTTNGSGTLSWGTPGSGGGDMLKSTYDTDDDGKVQDVNATLITNKAQISSGLAATDELLLSDSGVLKKLRLSDLKTWMGAGGTATNLTREVGTDSIKVLSDTGTDIYIPAATNTTAGLMTDSVKVILNSVRSPQPQGVTTLMALGTYCNFTTTVTADKSMQFKNEYDGATGTITAYYFGSGGKITFTSYSSYTVNVAENIYDSNRTVLTKSSGVAVYSYYIYDKNIYINGTQTYY